MRKYFLTHSYQKCTKEDALNRSLATFIYSPKQRFVLERRYNIFLAFTPLSRKKWSLRRVVSIIVLGISSRMELILRIQFRQMSCADSGTLVPYKSLIVTSLIFYSSYWGKLRLFILLKTLNPNYSTISIT